MLLDYAARNGHHNAVKPLKAALAAKVRGVNTMVTKKRLGSGQFLGHLLDKPQRARGPAPTTNGVICGAGLEPNAEDVHQETSNSEVESQDIAAGENIVAGELVPPETSSLEDEARDFFFHL